MVIDFYFFIFLFCFFFFKKKALAVMLFDTDGQSRMLHTKRFLNFLKFIGRENKSCKISHWKLKLKLMGSAFLN